jgi:hypothetical protein
VERVGDGEESAVCGERQARAHTGEEPDNFAPIDGAFALSWERRSAGALTRYPVLPTTALKCAPSPGSHLQKNVGRRRMGLRMVALWPHHRRVTAGTASQ